MQRNKDSLKNDKNKLGDMGKRQQAGTKWSHYGQRGPGIHSTLDAERVKRNLEEKQINRGGAEAGGVRYAVMSADGKPKPHAPINIDGRVHYSDVNGIYYEADTEALEEMARDAKERNEYIRKLLEWCLVSNQAMAMTTGLSEDDVKVVCAEGGANTFFGNIMSNDLDAANCEPDFMSSIDEGSVYFSKGISKLRKIVEFIMPIVRNMTSKSIANNGVE